MVPERPPLEIASAVNKVFIMGMSGQSRSLVQSSGGMAQRLAAKHQNDHNDQDNEAERAAAYIVEIGQNRRE